ncbi:helix-turn-helix transcriptional regulator [Collinsella sp. An307]|uniref:helix-turn-helix transcriptional regulator n=1 Tax=Collinsella sp. An307 TaxID=1965630 RepID=UPI0013027469|nr:helix-turn-helix transcriptional regulator [Collinsella sp. An307]
MATHKMFETETSGDRRVPACIAERVREHRLAAGISQEALAELCHVSRQTIGNWECGRTVPDVLMLANLADVLGTTANDILGSDAPSVRRRAAAARREFVLVCGIILSIQLITMLLNGFAVGTNDPDWGGGAAFSAFRLGVLVVGCLWITSIARREGLHTIRQMIDFASLASAHPGSPGDRALRFIGRWFWTLLLGLAAAMYAVGGAIAVFASKAEPTVLIAPALMFLVVAIPFSWERNQRRVIR